MSDAAGFGAMVKTAKLLREIDIDECQRRNALSNKRGDLRLRQGTVVTVLESLDQGRAFLVEFGERSPETCDWLGVLYPPSWSSSRDEFDRMKDPTRSAGALGA